MYVLLKVLSLEINPEAEFLSKISKLFWRCKLTPSEAL